MFDDLIPTKNQPQKTATAPTGSTGGMFDDLVPNPQDTVADKVSKYIQNSPYAAPGDKIVAKAIPTVYNIGKSLVQGITDAPGALGETAINKLDQKVAKPVGQFIASKIKGTNFGNAVAQIPENHPNINAAITGATEPQYRVDTTPRQVIGDTITSASEAIPVGQGANFVKNIGAGALTGAGYNLGNSIRNNDSLTDTAFNTGVGGAVGAAFPIAGKFLGKAGEILGNRNGYAADIMNKVARINPTDARDFVKLSGGKSHGEFLTDNGIYGTPDQIAEQLITHAQKSTGEVDNALTQMTGQYRLGPVSTMLKDMAERDQRVSSIGAPDIHSERINYLFNKNKTEGLTMSEINEVKRIYEKTNRLDYIKSNMTQPEKAVYAKNLDSAVRKAQLALAEQNGLKNLGELNKNTQLSYDLADAIAKKERGQVGNNAISLTDFILLAGGEPKNVAEFLTKRLISSKTVQSKVAEMLSTKVPQEIKADFNKNPVGLLGTKKPNEPINVPPGGFKTDNPNNYDFINQKPPMQRKPVVSENTTIPSNKSTIGKSTTVGSGGKLKTEEQSLQDVANQQGQEIIHIPEEYKAEARQKLQQELERLQMEKEQAQIMKQINQDAADSYDNVNVDTRAYKNMRDAGATDMESTAQTDASGKKSGVLRDIEMMGAGKSKDVSTQDSMEKLDRILELRKKARESGGIRETDAQIAEIKRQLGDLDKMGGFVDPRMLTAGGLPIALGTGALKLASTPSTKTVFGKQPTPEKQAQNMKEQTLNTNTKPFVESTRGVTVSPDDVRALLPIVYGEISNRSPKKQELEARVILNTALNRVKEYAKHGVKKTLKEVLEQPNQYQAFGGKQYKHYNATTTDSDAKHATVDQIVNKLVQEMQSGNFADNTNGAYYYVHKGNGSIEYDNKKPLISQPKKTNFGKK